MCEKIVLLKYHVFVYISCMEFRCSFQNRNMIIMSVRI